MVVRVEAGVRAVERHIERKDVHPAECPRQRAAQQLGEPGEVATESVGVGDELGRRA